MPLPLVHIGLGSTQPAISVALGPPERPVVSLLEPHSEAKPLRSEEIVYLLERLLAEVIDVQHLLFGALNQIPNSLDVLLLETVPAAHAELGEVLDRPVQHILYTARNLSSAAERGRSTSTIAALTPKRLFGPLRPRAGEVAEMLNRKPSGVLDGTTHFNRAVRLHL